MRCSQATFSCEFRQFEFEGGRAGVWDALPSAAGSSGLAWVPLVCKAWWATQRFAAVAATHPPNTACPGARSCA